MMVAHSPHDPIKQQKCVPSKEHALFCISQTLSEHLLPSLLLVNALVVCTALWTCLAARERTLSTWLSALSCLCHIL